MLDKKMYKEVPEVVDCAVENALGSLGKKTVPMRAGRRGRKRVRAVRGSWAAAACLVCFLTAAVTVCAMGAVSLYRSRMEEMSEDELEEYFTIAMSGETTGMSRTFTREEWQRYERLEQEYQKNGLFPEGQISCLKEGEVYSGTGIALDSSGRTLYLPDRELNDEELLEIIDLFHKTDYSIYRKNEERILSGDGWESRMASMDDAETDEVYRTMFGSRTEISGVYSRTLTEEEKARYDALTESYETKGIYAEAEITVIQTAAEYTGNGVAICAADSTFYLPEEALRDEEFLQLIEYEHKALYCIDRINQEIRLGLREGYPE